MCRVYRPRVVLLGLFPRIVARVAQLPGIRLFEMWLNGVQLMALNGVVKAFISLSGRK